MQLRDGDNLMIHAGWASHHLHEIDDQQRTGNTTRIRTSGLLADTDTDTVAWPWDCHFSVVATDNSAVEAWSAFEDSPVVTDSARIAS